MTVSKYPMSAFPDNEIIDQIATELNIDSVFLEKDWHVSNAIKAISEFENDIFEPIFCGGTSLLKGYKIIKRFSEDVDFRILNVSGNPASRGDRRGYRDALVDHLSTIPELEFNIDNLISRDSSRFFGITASYPKRFGDHQSIRSELKLEGTFVEETLPGLEEKEIKPIIGEHIKTDNNSVIRCLSLLETTADKASALVWRIPSRNRKEEGDDPSIIRHLYDFHKLYGQFENFSEIMQETKTRYQIDRRRGSDDIPETYEEALITVIDTLREDPLYMTEYNQYALNMCFGKETPPDFDQALGSFSSLKEHL